MSRQTRSARETTRPLWRLALVGIGLAALGLSGCDHWSTGELAGFGLLDDRFVQGSGLDGRHVPRRPLDDL